MAEQLSSVGAVIPNLWVESVETLRSFYLDKLGFTHAMGMVGKDGKLDFCIVTREGAMIMMGRPQEKVEGAAEKYSTNRPVEIYIFVKDVDLVHAEVAGRGVKATQPLTTQWWGDRNFAVKDPYGYTIWLCQTIGPVVPPPGVTMV
jgi:uncharacterized glyoxalase superfamily protein PhnB